jgi:hypothetical protein
MNDDHGTPPDLGWAIWTAICKCEEQHRDYLKTIHDAVLDRLRQDFAACYLELDPYPEALEIVRAMAKKIGVEK